MPSTLNLPSPNRFFQMGQHHPDYAVPVLNERAVRASAGLLFFFAIVAFMNAWLSGNFQPTRIFVVAFLADFSVRIFVNPLLAPSLIVGQWLVRKQQAEYVGAPQCCCCILRPPSASAWAARYTTFLIGKKRNFARAVHVNCPLNKDLPQAWCKC